MAHESPEQKAGPHKPRKVPGTSAPARVLLTEDDDELRRLLAECLRCEGFVVTECSDGVRMAQFVGAYVLKENPNRFDVIVSDVRMPGLTGLEVLEGMQEWDGFPPIILITAFGDDDVHAEAKRLGAHAVLDKPFEMQELLLKIREVTESLPPETT